MIPELSSSHPISSPTYDINAPIVEEVQPWSIKRPVGRPKSKRFRKKTIIHAPSRSGQVRKFRHRQVPRRSIKIEPQSKSTITGRATKRFGPSVKESQSCPTLTKEQESLVDKIMAQRPARTIHAELYKITINVRDVQTLQPRQWVVSEVSVM